MGESKKLDTLVILFQEATNKRDRDNIYNEISKKLNKRMFSIAAYYSKRYGMEYDDMYQTLWVTLLNACDKFKSNKNVCFNTYFTSSIRANLAKEKHKYCKHTDLIHAVDIKCLDKETTMINSREDIENIDCLIDIQNIVNNNFCDSNKALYNDIFVEDYTRPQLAKRFNLSQTQISRKKNKIILELKKYLGDD